MADNKTYAAFVLELVQRQDDRKASLEARGITVVTTAGAVATLLFGAAALAHGSSAIKLSGAAAVLLKLALVAFGIAAGLAFATNVPLNYDEPGKDTATSLLAHWADTEDFSLEQVTKAWGQVFKKAKAMNEIKAMCLVGAVLAEVVGVGLIASVVWIAV